LQKYLVNKVNWDIKTFGSDVEEMKIVFADDTEISFSFFDKRK
jgi:hypothetical protein